jgi:hypothetical protein
MAHKRQGAAVGIGGLSAAVEEALQNNQAVSLRETVERGQFTDGDPALGHSFTVSLRRRDGGGAPHKVTQSADQVRDALREHRVRFKEALVSEVVLLPAFLLALPLPVLCFHEPLVPRPSQLVTRHRFDVTRLQHPLKL